MSWVFFPVIPDQGFAFSFINSQVKCIPWVETPPVVGWVGVGTLGAVPVGVLLGQVWAQVSQCHVPHLTTVLSQVTPISLRKKNKVS